MDLSSLAGILLAFVVVAASPGPANLACATVAMRQGRAAGMRFALGLASGLAVWGVLAAVGMGAVLQTSQVALVALKLLGGAYLLWLAFGSARSAATPGAPMLASQEAGGRWMLRGLLLNLTNPKAVFAWMAALAVGLGPADGLAGLGVATALCAVLGLINYLIWASVFSTSRAMSLYARSRRWVDGAVAALFATAGIGLIRSALVRA